MPVMRPRERIALASKSPRRREILASLGWDFDVAEAGVDEAALPGEAPAATAHRLARAKAEAGSRGTGGLLTIGADTVVDIDGRAFGKPRDAEDASRMLRALSGREHLVHTGIAAARSGRVLASETETTRVRFGELTDGEIRDFIESGEPFDKAGGYAIQGIGASMIEGIEGCFYNVVGLPVFRLCRLLELPECSLGGERR